MRVAVIVATVSIAAFLVLQVTGSNATSDLQSGTTQAAARVSTLLSSPLPVLDALAANVRNTDGSPAEFLAAARALVHEPFSAALAKSYFTLFVFFATLGPDLRFGQQLSDTVALATHRSETAPTPGPLVSLGPDDVARYAAGAPVVPDGMNAISRRPADVTSFL